MTKTRVLFICASNTTRSQMAKAFLKKYAGDRYEGFSAGLGPGPMNPLTVRVMEEKGISMRGHYPKGADGFLGMFLVSTLLSITTRRLSVRFFPIPAFDCAGPLMILMLRQAQRKRSSPNSEKSGTKLTPKSDNG
jgi:hypothetical protein